MLDSPQKRVSVARDRLARELADRYRRNSKDRDARLDRIDKEGILAAAGTVAAARRAAHMTRAEGSRLFEAVVGGADDSDHVNFLSRGLLAARAVCRLVQGGSPVGTGFLVAPGLLLTNNHVIASAEEAATFVAEFDYELDLDDQPRRPVVRFQVRPDDAFVTSSAADGLDFTFVALEPTSLDGAHRIESFGWLPMDERTDKILEGEPAVVIQHPRGEPKRLCLFEAELVDRPENYIHYTTDTDGGASGSPVTNRGWLLIGLHHAAVTTDRVRRGHRIVVNEGIRVSSMLRALRSGDGVDGDDRVAILGRITRVDVLAGPRRELIQLRGAAEGVRDPEAGIARSLEATKIGRRDPNHFESRDAAHLGYRPSFLGGSTDLPLPQLPNWMKSDAARVAGTNGVVLTYTHYSVVHSRSRRLPILTGVNIDGAKAQRLGREDRYYEAADKWFFDPRIDEDLQLGPEIYDGTPFDFGHMVRREDPVWGNLNTARMGNDDTFYMTNCAPQHSNLNQRTWLSLENAVLAAARDGKAKVTVFTGPILSPQDPTFRGVQIPTAFWKVVAYRSGGKLRAHGFMQWQTELVDEVRMKYKHEALDGIEGAAEYQVAIRDIARDSSLDFGNLVDADEDLGGGDFESTGGNRRRRLSDQLIERLAERIASADASGDDTGDGGSPWVEIRPQSRPSVGGGTPAGTEASPLPPSEVVRRLVASLRAAVDEAERSMQVPRRPRA